MTQNELAFWRDAIIAALHAPGDAIERANLALIEYRKAKAAADTYHKSAVVVRNPTHFCSVCSITFDTDEAFRTHIDTKVKENA
jgi:hypothetical protein